MRIPILFIFFASLFSCRGNVNEHQTQVYSSQDGEFIIRIDTLNIYIKPYVAPNIKVSLTHAVKYGEKYYCYFTDEKDSYNKYFFVISNTGKIEKNIKLPKDLTDCFYLDLFVLHDTIFSTPYMNDNNYYFDLHKLSWVKTDIPDDIIYEDERFYITYIDFGEWGSTTWFKDKSSGIEYELASSGEIINRIDSSYYISSGLRVLKIDNPLKMKQCDKEYYYQKVKKENFSKGTNSLVGTETMFKDTTYSQWDLKEPKLGIATSFKVDNKLFYLCNDSEKTFIAKLENKKMIPILSFKEKYYIFDRYYSYRCKIQKDNFQLLKFYTKINNTFGLIEIEEKNINIRYLKLIIE